MSFLAKLVLGDKEYQILTVEYDFMQPVDQSNRPNGAVRGGLIHMVLESSNNFVLSEWMFRHSMTKAGSIVFYRRDAMSAAKTVSFTDAFCIYLKESFNSEGKTPMLTRITISAREIKISNKLSLANPWPALGSSEGNVNKTAEAGNNESITSFDPNT